MATKTITITTQAYEKLAAMKTGNESFSEVITKLTAKGSILDLVGTLTDKEATMMNAHRTDLRKRWEISRNA